MSKFNNVPTGMTTDHEGYPAYAMTDRARLVTQVLTSFFREAKFYGDNSAEIELTLRRVIREDPDFVSRLAVFARREFNMRSIAQVLAAYLAHEPAGKPFARRTVSGIALRGDDVTELMAFYLSSFGKPIPNALRKGINDALARFDEYTLAKYSGLGKKISMRDVVKLCHPAPVDEAQAALWKRLLENRLNAREGWEAELSARGNTAGAWERLIDSGRLGYMALLRNLRNIIEAKPANIDKVWERIEDPEAVRRSRQLPFRFLSAYREVFPLASRRGKQALESAVLTAADSLPRLPGRTLIALDTSSSMEALLSRRSTVSCAEVGMLLALIAERVSKQSLFYTFNTKIEEFPAYEKRRLLYTCMKRAKAYGATNIGLPFELMISRGILVDRVILISDNECNTTTAFPRMVVQVLADRYREQTGNDLWVHAIDMQGYGTQQFAGPHTNIIAGWSEKVLQFIPLAEQGAGTLETKIAGYTWE